MIRLKSVNKSYGNREILKNINLEAPKERITVLLGPNGAGKTTTLNIIAGIVLPDSGIVEINGDTVFQKDGKIRVNIPPERRNVGYIPQEYALFPHLTVYENISFGLKARKLSRDMIKERVNTLVDLFGIRHLLNKYPAQLSGGERQKVALVRALAPQPKVLLMDEPFTSIDPGIKPHLQKELRDLIKKLDITTLIVTHDLNEAWALADKIAVLMDGRIQAEGMLQTLYRNIRIVKVAEFLGLNVLEGVVIEAGSKVVKVASKDDEILLTAFKSDTVLRRGDRVCILFEPDAIVLAGNNYHIKENEIRVKVTSVFFNKCNITLLLETRGGCTIKAKLSRGYIMTDGKFPEEGSTICITIPPHLITIVKKR